MWVANNLFKVTPLLSVTKNINYLMTTYYVPDPVLSQCFTVKPQTTTAFFTIKDEEPESERDVNCPCSPTLRRGRSKIQIQVSLLLELLITIHHLFTHSSTKYLRGA